jgi:hypothetical protein
MSSFTAKPLDAHTPLDSVQGRDWFLKLQAFLQHVGKLKESQVFSGVNVFANGAMQDSGIMLNGKFSTQVLIQKISKNNKDANSGGGNAGLYVQHLVDNSVAAINNVSCGIRVQMQSTQQFAAPATVNDVVSGYFGLYNAGLNTGGFGIHTDAYHAATGAGCTTYGSSVEMYRTSGLGVTVGYLMRSIDGTGRLQQDFGFAAMPSVGGAIGATYAFAAGSALFGVFPCDYGLDLAYATSTAAAVRIKEDRLMIWNGIAASSFATKYSAANTRWEMSYAGTLLMAVNQANGRIVLGAAHRTTIGVAGGATALPATPLGYVDFEIPGVGTVAVPYYNP